MVAKSGFFSSTNNKCGSVKCGRRWLVIKRKPPFLWNTKGDGKGGVPVWELPGWVGGRPYTTLL